MSSYPLLGTNYNDSSNVDAFNRLRASAGTIYSITATAIGGATTARASIDWKEVR